MRLSSSYQQKECIIIITQNIITIEGPGGGCQHKEEWATQTKGGGGLGTNALTETLRRWDWSQTVSRRSRVFCPPWGSNSIWQHWKDGGSALIPAGALSLYTFKIWPAIPLSPAPEMQELRLHLSFHGTEGTAPPCASVWKSPEKKKERNKQTERLPRFLLCSSGSLVEGQTEPEPRMDDTHFRAAALQPFLS